MITFIPNIALNLSPIGIGLLENEALKGMEMECCCCMCCCMCSPEEEHHYEWENRYFQCP